MSAGPTLLLVEDDRDLRRAVAAGLAHAQWTVQEAGDLEEACAALRALRFDAVVTEAVLAGRDASPVLAELEARAPATPLVVLCAWEPPPRWQEGRVAVTWLAKPLDLARLVETLRRVIAR